MKKKIITFAVSAMSLLIASCGSSNGFLEEKDTVTKGNSNKMDTLSYVIGMNIGNQIEYGIKPQLRDINYGTLVETIEAAALAPEKIINVLGVEISKEKMPTLAEEHLGLEFNSKIMAAMNDSTGNTSVFADENEKNIVSALLGANIGYSLIMKNIPVQTTWVLTGIKDVENGETKIDEMKAHSFINNYFSVVVPEQAKKISQEWLSNVEEMGGVEKTASGILYQIVDAGDPDVKAINDEDEVKVLYTGRDCYGKVFDSNRWNDLPKERQEMYNKYSAEKAGKDNPVDFALNQVIKGWTEGMKLIGKGGRISLWIPAELAYGERGAGQDIGPNEALYFDVELLDVTPAK